MCLWKYSWSYLGWFKIELNKIENDKKNLLWFSVLMIFLTRYFLNRTEINTFSRLICVNLLRRNFIIKLLIERIYLFIFFLYNKHEYICDLSIFSMCVVFIYISFLLVEYDFDITDLKMNRDKSNYYLWCCNDHPIVRF